MLSIARCFLIAGLALSVSAVADDAIADAGAQPQRKVLERHDQSGVPGKEVVIGTATLPPGTSIGFHDPPGMRSGTSSRAAWSGRSAVNLTRP